jgi:formylglycine-generating enzyme required for sulfatase activity
MKHSNDMEVAARLGVRVAQHGARRRATRNHRSDSPEFVLRTQWSRNGRGPWRRIRDGVTCDRARSISGRNTAPRQDPSDICDSSDRDDPPRFAQYSRTADSPQVAVSWYDAARYCNWLSEQAGMSKNEWVYPADIDSEQGIDLPADYLHRSGFRLPTEAEWEYAARAGTTTSRHFGNDEKLLPQYAWYDGDTNRERAYPVAQLLPNQWGLFDMLGNVWEWTFDRRQSYPSDERVTDDVEDSALHVSNNTARTRRGGSFAYEWFTVRSAHRGDVTYFPNQTRDGVGFRVARTMP